MSNNHMAEKMLPPIRITKAQRDWLDDERKRTGNTLAVLVRNLIQERIPEKTTQSGS